MKRRLLPYEHELIQILGISEEDYLDFLAVQHDFSRSPEEKLQELRGEPVSIVLAVVGILFQVASLLLAPKPEIPNIKQAARNSRDQQFSPRFGFNSLQELAKYGDPVNLIYTNTDDNPTGGVRAATSLVWAAVQSGGSSQFMQMLMTLGAGPIQQIDFQKTAFGQTPITQFATQRAWTYFSTGLPRFTSLASGDSTDPTRTGLSSSSYCYLVRAFDDQKQEGFSQAFSPTTLNRCGVFAPIPINAEWLGRDPDGDRRFRDLGITASGLEAYWPEDGSRPVIPVGHTFSLTFTQYTQSGDTYDRGANDTKLGLYASIDKASLYKLGSAVFRVSLIQGDGLQQSDCIVTFQCVRAGLCPEVKYSVKSYTVLQPTDTRSYFYDTKCLVKIENAQYATITDCSVIEFALKAKVFKRVQGRAGKYANNDPGYSDTDNGVKFRVTMFWLFYRPTSTANWTRVNAVFAIRNSADIDNFVFLRFRLASNTGGYEFRFDPIADPASEMRLSGITSYAYIENAESGGYRTINNPDGTFVQFIGNVYPPQFTYLPSINSQPKDITEWTLFSTSSDTQLQFSFDQGPEIMITAVTEQRIEAFANYPSLYSNLAMLGFNTYSGQGIQDLRSITAFVKKGKLLRRLSANGTYPAQPDGSSSYAPDIFLDTILDSANGIGRFAKIEGIDLPALGKAKQFCVTNKFYMDCVIAERVSWRQFWSEVALYSLLEFGRIGGKETLIPAIPTNQAGQIVREVSVTALFNQGNIIEDSYKEEFLDYGSDTQDLIATIIYRDTQFDEMFPRNVGLEIRRVGVTDAIAVRQTFDLSQYVANRAQAIAFGKLLCNQRAYIRKAIEFSTFPTDSVISPGAYIYVAVGRNEWDKISTGVVEAGGALNTPLNSSVISGSYNVLLYKSGAPVVSLTGVTVSNNTASSLASYEGYVFVLGSPISRNRVFRVSEVQMDEDGQVNVKAIEHPCVYSGTQALSLISEFSDSSFVVR